MDIVEKLRLVDCQFWWKPLGHGIDTDLDVPAYELGALSHEAADEIERERGRSDYFIENGIHLAKTIRALEKICPNVPRHFWLSAKKSYSVFMQEEADWLKRRVEWEKKCFGDPPEPVFREND